MEMDIVSNVVIKISTFSIIVIFFFSCLKLIVTFFLVNVNVPNFTIQNKIYKINGGFIRLKFGAALLSKQCTTLEA